MKYYLSFGLDSKNIILFCTVIDENKNIEYCGDYYIGDRIINNPETMSSKHLFVYKIHPVPIPSTQHLKEILHTNLTSIINKPLNQILMKLKLEEYII